MKVLSETTESMTNFLDRCSPFGFSTTLIVLSTAFEDKSLVGKQYVIRDETEYLDSFSTETAEMPFFILIFVCMIFH